MYRLCLKVLALCQQLVVMCWLSRHEGGILFSCGLDHRGVQGSSSSTIQGTPSLAQVVEACILERKDLNTAVDVFCSYNFFYEKRHFSSKWKFQMEIYIFNHKFGGFTPKIENQKFCNEKIFVRRVKRFCFKG